MNVMNLTRAAATLLVLGAAAFAQQTGGTYQGATDARSLATLAAAAARGGTANRAPGESLPDNRYAWFLGLAIALIAADALAERGKARGEG